MGRAIFGSILALVIAAGAAPANTVDAARAALAAKDNASAVELATDALGAANISKADATALHVVRGQAYLAEEQYDDAIVDIGAAIDASAAPGDVCAALGDVFVIRGDANIGLRRFRDASNDFTKAVLCEPGNPAVRYKLGTAYFHFDKTNARDAFNEAIRLKPDYLEAVIARARNYENMRDFDKALVDYGEALRLDPGNALTYNDRATIYSILGRLDDALADYNKSIELDSANFLAYLNRAYLYYRKKDYKAARMDLDYAKQLRSDPKLNEEFDKHNTPAFLKRLEADLDQLDEDLTNAPP